MTGAGQLTDGAVPIPSGTFSWPGGAGAGGGVGREVRGPRPLDGGHVAHLAARRRVQATEVQGQGAVLRAFQRKRPEITQSGS